MNTISDTEARRISAEWHGGGGTALYAFSSTGAIDTARDDHDIHQEIVCAYDELEFDTTMTVPVSSVAITLSARSSDLVKLEQYIDAHGTRGPVEGWSNLTW